LNKILNIKKGKRDRYFIEIETKQGKIPHVISENTIIKYNLLNKKILDNAEYNKMIKDNEYEILYLKSINYISYQMRTISEVKKHLRKDTRNESLINKIISELKANKYVNDTYFVTEYVKQKIEFDLVGPRYIKDKLVSKGIHFDLITNALLNYNENIQFDKVYELIHKELKYKQKKPYQKVYLSLKQKLITKGFSLNVIESSLLSSKEDILEKIDSLELLKKDYFLIYDKFDLNIYEEKNNLIKKLMSKGHDYELIKTFINEE
jgi:regulatory protein